MAETYQELYDGYLKADKNTVAEIASEKFCNIMNKVRKETGDSEFAFKVATLAFSSFVVMDNKLSDEEWALFQFIMQQKISREEVIQLCKCGESGKGAELLKELADEDPEFKRNVIVLGLCVCAIDGHIAPGEHSLLKYYMD